MNRMKQDNYWPGWWTKTQLGDCLPLMYGKGLPKRERDESGNVPVYGSNGIVGYHSEALTKNETIVVGRKGTVGSVHHSPGPCWPIDTTYFVENPEGNNLRFCYYLLMHLDLESFDRSTTIPGLNRKDYNGIKAALPSIDEQKRIVKKIEELFSNLDAGVAALERVHTNLQRYRASVLKAAVEGELTKQWRVDNPDVEPADKLLERILQERRVKWEQDQLAKYEAKGKKPPKNWKSQYKEPVAPDTSNLPELPKGWCWASLSQVATFQNGRAFPSREYTNDGIKLLRPGNLFADGTIRWNEKNTRRMPESWANKYPDYIVYGGELIMNLTAQSLKDAFLGRACITGPKERCLLNQRLARITPIKPMNTQYTLFLLKSAIFREFVASLNTGSLIQHMFVTQLYDFIFPLPPRAEQDKIVAECDRHFHNIEHISSIVNYRIKTAGTFRQSILKRAFDGKLVENDSLSTHDNVYVTDSAKFEDMHGEDHALLHGN